MTCRAQATLFPIKKSQLESLVYQNPQGPCEHQPPDANSY